MYTLLMSVGLGSFQRRYPGGRTCSSSDRSIKMCATMEKCVYPRSDGQLDCVYVYSHGHWITLFIKQDGGDLFPYLCLRYAWFGTLYCKLIYSSLGNDERRADDHDGFPVKESATRYVRQYSGGSTLRCPLLLVHSRDTFR